ncbi:TonB-dependent receptor [Sphingosinicella rhizophila]|uniref:TonB-dependent receptor plug domain-containing protein n=1 Tax=Sphingosinicella rhizophila TaxID=3050082 RepID=A0ABU3Q410_9SPHN|nr:TonB-dependent receptor plug domain-containing protein [Sphingosinicella sp. GR2756]MDT9598162.1 TonB-dependent receptor plug domain-containing protein [Sphingosinicella sp. GR2756]
MNFSKAAVLVLLPVLSPTLPANAQAVSTQDQAPAPAPDLEDDAGEPFVGQDILVVGDRGRVIGDIPPEDQLNEDEIAAYGAGSVAELLGAIAPRLRSNRGRVIIGGPDGGANGPVILLNGQRISSFAELQDLPPEAIQRVDIFPEEVALKYGYRADQRVVNFVLKPNFRAVTAELKHGMATAGGRGSYEAGINIARINTGSRWNLDAEYQRDDPLLESERSLQQAPSPLPFDLTGNIGAAAGLGQEIDPGLSSLAGSTVGLAAVPALAAKAVPTLADFAAGANSANMTDIGDYRTLLPAIDRFSANGTYSRSFGSVSATINARFEATDTASRLGLPSSSLLIPGGHPYSPFASDVLLHLYFDAAGPLMREAKSRTSHFGLSANGAIAPWRWSFIANYDKDVDRIVTDRGLDLADVQARIAAGDPSLNPFAPLENAATVREGARTDNETAEAELTANGTLFDLPGGPIATTLKAGVETRDFSSTLRRPGVENESRLSRDIASGQVNVDIPVTSRRTGFLGAIGTLSANANFAVDRLSDFGTLRTIGYGANWSPIEEVNLIASVTEEDGAPTMQQLGDPALATPNVRVFDFLRNETVDVTRIDGGNPGLVADNRRVTKLGFSAQPFEDIFLSFNANYTASRIDNPIASFPTATLEIEAAFPDRFTRDTSGRLLQIDARPVNFTRWETRELRWGFTFRKPFGTPPPRGGGAPPPAPPAQRAPDAKEPPPAGSVPPGNSGAGAAPPPGSVPAGPARPPAGGPRIALGTSGSGGMQFGIYHNWRFQDEILIRPGLPELDLLNGSAIGSTGGRPRHEIDVQSGVFRNGLGVQLNAKWQSGTFVRGGATSSDLFFSDLATINLSVFVNFNERKSLVGRLPFLRNSRFTLAVDNLFDSRLKVTDATGATPIGYQSALLDPLGRAVRLTLRKQFF